MTDTAPKFEDIKEAAHNVKTELVDNILTPPEIALEMTTSQDLYVYYREGDKVKKATIAAGRYLFSIGNKEGDIAPELVKRIKANVPDDIEASNAIFTAWLYRFNVAPSELERVQETGEITGHFLPVRLSNRPNSPLTYGELLNWVIAQGLKKKGNPEAADWFKFALDISSNPDGIKSILNEQDTENEASAETTSKGKLNMTGAIVRNNLTALTWNFDKSFIQILEGYETIAKNSKATVIIAKDFDGNEMQLAANTDEVKYYFDLGGDRYFLGKVLQVVTSLVKQANTADFKTDGRVWFTVNKIAAEVTRTSAGVAEIRKRPDWITLTDAALVLLTGSRLKGTNSAFVGGTQNLDYIANGIRRESVIVNGIEYRAVWGFEDKGENSYNSYKAVEAHSFEYPLLDAVKPLTPTQSSYETVLRRALHQCRKKLYYETVKNAQKKHRDVYQLSLPYDDIFNAFGASSSRQKLAVVRGLEAVLKALAEDEAAGKVDEKRPLHIVAYSRRDAAKGRGAGKWVALVIEAHRFHTVKTPHVDLQTSKEKKTS